jgi:hypothetical protein
MMFVYKETASLGAGRLLEAVLGENNCRSIVLVLGAIVRSLKGVLNKLRE